MLLSNYEIALKLSKGERVALASINDKKAVIMHLEAIERNCRGIVNAIKQELHND